MEDENKERREKEICRSGKREKTLGG